MIDILVQPAIFLSVYYTLTLPEIRFLDYYAGALHVWWLLDTSVQLWLREASRLWLCCAGAASLGNSSAAGALAMLSVQHAVESCLPLACSCNRRLAVQSQMLAPAAPLAPGCIWSGQYLSRAHGPVCQCAPQWLRRSPHAPQHTPQVLDA